MDSLTAAKLVVYRAIVARFPPGRERERWLHWLNRGRIRCTFANLALPLPGMPSRIAPSLGEHEPRCYQEHVLAFALRAHLSALLRALVDSRACSREEVRQFLVELERETLGVGE